MSSFYNDSINLICEYKGILIFISIIFICKNKLLFNIYYSKHTILQIKKKIFQNSPKEKAC